MDGSLARRAGTLALLVCALLVPTAASAHHKPDHHDVPGAGPPPATATRAGKAPAKQHGGHPSGKDRSTEPGGSGTQGAALSIPDQDGHGPERDGSGTDKPGAPADVDPDGNNGCGNDADFEDDNEGWCGGRATASAPTLAPQASGTVPGIVQKFGFPPAVAGPPIETPPALAGPPPEAPPVLAGPPLETGPDLPGTGGEPWPSAAVGFALLFAGASLLGAGRHRASPHRAGTTRR